MIRQLILMILLTGLLFSCKSKEETVQPEMKSLTEAVYASGTLIAEKEYKVVSAIDGYLTNALVNEGDSIKPGMLLFTVTNNTRNAQQQSAVSMLEKTLPVVNAGAPVFKELQSQLILASQKMQNDSLQYSRYKNLYENDAVSKSQYEKYQLQYQSSQTEFNRIKEQLSGQQLNAALQKQQVANQLQMSKTDNNNGMLKSFTDGVVYEIYKQKGDMVNMNQPIALIGSGKMIAKLSVDEDDLNRIYTGQKLYIKMDAFPDQVFDAVITKIYPVLNKVEQSFRVDAEFTQPLPFNIYGLNIEANIVVAENKKTMVIPKKAVLNGDSVMIKNGDSTLKVKITTGVEDGEWVQVTSGITPSSLLIIKP